MSIKSKKEIWIKQYWRPMMAWQYLIVCYYDFLLAPIIYNHISLINPEHIVQWDPITLQAGGLYHIAMAAIQGIYTWTRGLEKMEMIKHRIIPLADNEKINELHFEDSEEDIFNEPPKRRRRRKKVDQPEEDERDY